MTTTAHRERQRRVKLATEVVEDELNRLGPESLDDEVRDGWYAVIRHLKQRWADLSQDTPETRENAPRRAKAWL